MCEEKKTGYPSIDKPWLKYYDEKALHAQPTACTVYQNIYRHNKEHLNDTALEYFGVKSAFPNYLSKLRSVQKPCSITEYAPGTVSRFVPREHLRQFILSSLAVRSVHWPTLSTPCSNPPRFVTASTRRTLPFYLCWISSTPVFRPSFRKPAFNISLFFLQRHLCLHHSASFPISKTLLSRL